LVNFAGASFGAEGAVIGEVFVVGAGAGADDEDVKEDEAGVEGVEEATGNLKLLFSA
jgi:hypothetical protein